MINRPLYRSTPLRPIAALALALLILVFVAEISASQPDYQAAFAPSVVKEDALNNPNLHPSLRRYVAVVNSLQDQPAWPRDAAEHTSEYSSLGGDIHEVHDSFAPE